MEGGQYHSSPDREMYLHHLQTAHGVVLQAEQSASSEPGGEVTTL